MNPVNKITSNVMIQIKVSNRVTNRYIKLTSPSRNNLLPTLLMGVSGGERNFFGVVISPIIISKM